MENALECQRGLERLFSRVEGVSEIIVSGDPLPAFDLHSPMMSLPLVFATRIDTIPAAIPYLHADPLEVARWRERLHPVKELQREERPEGKLKVGIVWAGGLRPGQPNAVWADRRRSLLLSQLAPLAKTPGVAFVSLQKGSPAAEAKMPPDGMELLDWTEELHDFADTAALVESLDLVISVDTAVAHLAGALGKPVWLLNRFDTCWRWLLDREDSPWYPVMRLFRQVNYGEWELVIQRVAEELAAYASAKA